MIDLQSLINYVTMVAAFATTVGVQILKSKFVPVQFERYPVPVTIVISAISTYIALLTQHFSFAWSHWTQVLGEFVTVLLVAAMTYNHVFANWPAVKETEGTSSKV